MVTTKARREKGPMVPALPKKLDQRLTVEHAVLDGIPTEDLKRIAGLAPRERFLRLSFLADQAAARMGA